MKQSLSMRNGEAVQRLSIPLLSRQDFLEEIRRRVGNKNRPLLFFTLKLQGEHLLYAVLADDQEGRLLITSTGFSERERSYPSLTPDIPSFHLFERELYEETGIRPEGHPWLKPLRVTEGYDFFSMRGDEIHEVAVGPIHAGVIEPGHFRFQCQGEKIHHLEIQHGYQHRGITALFRGKRPLSSLHTAAESIAGDSCIAHGEAWAALTESLSKTTVPEKAKEIRLIALELERAAMHIGDLGALSGDVGYLPGNSSYGATRTLVINSLLAICGSRFGRGLIKAGGVSFDIDQSVKERVLSNLAAAAKSVEITGRALFSSASVLSRFEKTGVVSSEDAAALGMVGPAARASGLTLDVRRDHPWGAYAERTIKTHSLTSGDVWARAMMRHLEAQTSLEIITEMLSSYPKGGELKTETGPLLHDSVVVSLTEGFRGEVCHACVTDGNGRVLAYRIKDPSFNNWMGLSLAVRGNGISDFPLCNKSFNLSYSGVDL